MSDYRFTVVIEQDEDGVFIASCPVLQGCHADGETQEEAIENLRDAIRLHVEARQSLGEPIPVEVANDQILINV